MITERDIRSEWSVWHYRGGGVHVQLWLQQVWRTAKAGTQWSEFIREGFCMTLSCYLSTWHYSVMWFGLEAERRLTHAKLIQQLCRAIKLIKLILNLFARSLLKQIKIILLFWRFFKQTTTTRIIVAISPSQMGFINPCRILGWTWQVFLDLLCRAETLMS